MSRAREMKLGVSRSALISARRCRSCRRMYSSKGRPPLRGIPGLAEEGRKRREVPEGDVRPDIDRVRPQQVGEERHLHRLALQVVGDVFAHVGGADAVIDGVVEPLPLFAHQAREPRLAETGHAEDGQAFLGRGEPGFGRCRREAAWAIPVRWGRAFVLAQGAVGQKGAARCFAPRVACPCCAPRVAAGIAGMRIAVALPAGVA
jgi:hypothetical protein